MGKKKLSIRDQDRPLLTLGLSLLRRELETRLAGQALEPDRAETEATLARIDRLRKRIEKP